MILEITFSSILLISLFGISIILLRKIAILAKLPEVKSSQKPGVLKEAVISTIKNGVKKIPGAQKLDYELYLQKVLSKVRVLTLKTESKTGSWLERLRKRRNGHNHDDGYWEELKKAKDGK